MFCFWCHNPESLSAAKDILYYEEKCNRCGKCVQVCPENCLSIKETGDLLINRAECTKCGKCVESCYADALKIVGHIVDIDTLMQEVDKDREFYEMSGGGITLSGGEPLLQARGCASLLESCKKRGIGTAIDTAGNVNWSEFELILPIVDYILYDVKTLNVEKHKDACGVSNRKVLDNLRRLSRCEVALIVRIPIVPGVNDTADDVGRIAEEMASFPNLLKVELLPFHRLAAAKYRALGKVYGAENIKAPGKESMAELEKVVSQVQICID
jgi:pyruvate formate lyase activating enzyme